jgi:hypothetical protein
MLSVKEASVLISKAFLVLGLGLEETARRLGLATRS